MFQDPFINRVLSFLAMSSTPGEHSMQSTNGFLFQNEAVSHSTEQVRESRNDIDGMLQQLSFYAIIISS